MHVKRASHLHSLCCLLCLFCLAISACTAPGPTIPTLTERPTLPPASATLVGTATPSPKPSLTPRPTATRHPTYTPTASETPTATPAPLVWAAPFANPIRLQDFLGYWSPTVNEMVGWRGIEAYSIALAEAPGFETHLAEMGSLVMTDRRDLGWNPDGKFIVFGGPSETIPDSQDFNYSALWMMDRQGRHVHQVLSRTYSGLRVRGWMSPRTIVITGNAGMYYDTYIVDTVSKTVRAEAQFSGEVFPPNRDFVPATYLWPSSRHKLYILGKVPLVKTPVSPLIIGPTTYVRKFPGTLPDDESFPCKWFLGWRAGGSQMLVLQYATYDPSDPVFGDIVPGRLILWDTLTDQLQLLYSDAIDGKLSPDSQLLAAVTRKNTTSESQATSQNTPTPSPETLQFDVHLMDVQSQAVKFSLPVFTDFDSFTQMYTTEMSFSPDSRYLALISPGPALQGPGGIPIARIDSRDATLYLNVIETQSGKVVAAVPCAGGHHWTTPVTPLVWSPSGMYLVYRDQQRNWQMIDLSQGSIQPITTSGGDILGGAAWSHDERYLSFHQYLETGRPYPHLSIYDTFIIDLGED